MRPLKMECLSSEHCDVYSGGLVGCLSFSLDVADAVRFWQSPSRAVRMRTKSADIFFGD